MTDLDALNRVLELITSVDSTDGRDTEYLVEAERILIDLINVEKPHTVFEGLTEITDLPGGGFRLSRPTE